jgi:RNA polymerase sigma factor (sigma-70 family)
VSLVRRGDRTAFEILYDRHARELLSFARHMLDSPQDAEDAVQSAFASAYRALVADEREVNLRPWLFAITRNACVSILRQRRPTVEMVAATAPRIDPEAQVEQREDLRQALASLLELPERQRTALILAELHGLSHSEIGTVLDVRAEQVKSYVYQARSSLSSERQARGADCLEIREELAVAHGAALLKSHLRRHLRSCPGCRAYSDELARRRRALGLLLPLAPSLALKRRALQATLGRAQDLEAWVAGTSAGASMTGAGAELVGGGANALLVKLLAGMACLAAAGTAVGTSVTSGSATHPRQAARAVGPGVHARPRLAVSAGPAAAPGPTAPSSPRVEPPPAGRGPTGVGSHPPAPAIDRQQPPAAPGSNGSEHSGAKGQEVNNRDEEPRGSAATNGEQPPNGEQPRGKSEGAQGKSEEPHGRGEEPHRKAEEPHGNTEESHTNAEEPHGKAEEPHGKSEEVRGQGTSEAPQAHGSGKSEQPHGKSEEARGGGGGRAEQPHGAGEEPHGHAEEAPPRGKSEEAPLPNHHHP